MHGCGAPAQQSYPIALGIRDHIPKLFTHQLGVLQVMMSADQLIPASALARQNQADLHFLQQALFVGIR
jgi:hypothetical protein